MLIRYLKGSGTFPAKALAKNQAITLTWLHCLFAHSSVDRKTYHESAPIKAWFVAKLGPVSKDLFLGRPQRVRPQSSLSVIDVKIDGVRTEFMRK